MKLFSQLLIFILVLNAQNLYAAGDTSPHPCTINLKDYQTSGTLAEFNLSFRCASPESQDKDSTDSELQKTLPLLLGLSVLVGEEGNADSDYDFAVQNFTLADGLERQFIFRAQLSDLVGRKYLETRVWPLHYLQSCTEGRSGCKKYGYALGKPEKEPDYCTDAEPLCSPSERQPAVKFR